MAKARLLPDALVSSKEFSLLQTDSALAFLMLLPHWDRDGLIDGDTVWELPRLMRGRDDLSRNLLAFVEKWETVGLIKSYSVGSRKILYWKKFRVHNPNIITSREAPSKFPPPPNYTRHEAGLIPENENEIVDLIPLLDPRSNYRIALERALAEKVGENPNPYADIYLPNSVSNHDLSLSTHDLSVRGRADHHNQSVVGGDQSIMSQRFLVNVQGGAGGIESLGELTHQQLVKVSLEMGNLLGLVTDWVGYLEFVMASDEETLARLIEWIQYQSDQPLEVIERIESMPALLRSNLNKGLKATLRSGQRQAMLEKAAQLCGIAKGKEVEY